MLLLLLACSGLVQAGPDSPAATSDPAQLPLHATVELALASPAVLLATQQLDTAQSRVQIAASPLSLQLSGGYTHSWNSTGMADGTVTTGSDSDWAPLELRASLNLIPLGPRFDQLRQAEIARQRAAGNLRTVRSDAIISAVSGHLAAVRAGEEVQLQQLAVAEARLQLDALAMQYRAGAANASQLLDAELKLNQAEAEEATARQKQAQELAGLSARLGTTVTAVATPELRPVPPAGNSTDAGRVQYREDVISARLGLLEAEITTAATRREHRPQGTLSLGYRTASDSGSLQLGASLDTRSFQPGVSLALDPDSGAAGLQPGMTSSGTSLGIRFEIPLDPALSHAGELARLTLAGAEVQLEQTIRVALNDIGTARLNLDSAAASLDLAEQLLAQGLDTLTAAQERFALGVISPFELQAAERRAAESRLRRNRAADSLLLARPSLARALALDPLEILK
jgi:outer membrane protein TolC